MGDTRFANVYAGDVVSDGVAVAIPDGTGLVDFPIVAAVRAKAAGGVPDSASPPLSASGPIVSVVNDSPGVYTVTLSNDDYSAAQLAPLLTVLTADLYGTCVVTSETSLAIALKTDAGVATNGQFTLALLALRLP